jgi:hypothetical protein
MAELCALNASIEANIWITSNGPESSPSVLCTE